MPVGDVTSQEANAKLIAAAPLMYEALEPFEAFINAFDSKPINGLDDDIYTIHAGTEWEATLTRTQMRAAREALRTARGETQEQQS